jgi:CelD/BcsL family acetyltransferase involved in cellulose biosynthesis
VSRTEVRNRAPGLDAPLVTRPDLGDWAGQWDAIGGQSALPTPFLRSWWLASTAGSDPVFVLVVAGGRLLGGVALERRRRLGVPLLQMMGPRALCPDHLDLLALPGEEDRVTDAVRRWLARPGTRMLDLDGLAAGGLLLRAVPGAVRTQTLAGARWAELPPSSAAYVADRPRTLRKTLRQTSARLAAEGVRHHVSHGPEVPPALLALRSLHAAQWGDGSRFLPDFERFATACRLGAQAGEVAVHELRRGDEVISSMVTFEVAGRISLYQSARRTESRWKDATTLLLAEAIGDACDRGFAEVDFLRGDEGYKANFAPQRRELIRLRSANGAAGSAALALEMTARGAKAYFRPSRGA